jgi:LmbE family N-acetylglucosaminyl deacetylase
LKFNPHSRLLVLAPHPDDEALGCGGLIQQAIATGAQVRVLFATDGDNNPWPQRVLERRIRITPHRRKAWGERRRGEAIASIRTLGLSDDDAVFAGLPDQGLTHDLTSGEGRFVAVLRRVAGAFEPTLVVGPSIGDTHPDHSAIAVMTRLQLHDTPQLEYAIHGRHGQGETIHLTPHQIATKKAAIQCHRTQVALSSRRFLAYAKATERFLTAEDDSAHHPIQAIARDDNGWVITLRPHRRLGHLAGRFVDLLALADGRIISRRRVRLAKRAHVIDLATGEAVASGCLRGNRLHIPAHSLPARMEAVLAKRTLRFSFFDEAGWRLLQFDPQISQISQKKQLVASNL